MRFSVNSGSGVSPIPHAGSQSLPSIDGNEKAKTIKGAYQAVVFGVCIRCKG